MPELDLVPVPELDLVPVPELDRELVPELGLLLVPELGLVARVLLVEASAPLALLVVRERASAQLGALAQSGA